MTRTTNTPKLHSKACDQIPVVKGQGFDARLLLRLAAYPHNAQDGDIAYRLQLRTFVDGELVDVIEQQQRGVTRINPDINIAMHYLVESASELEELEAEGFDAEFKTITLKLYTYKIEKVYK